MSTVDLNKDKILLDDGMDSIVIVKDLGDIPGGRSLEVKKLETEGDVIKSGHVIIKKDTNKPVFLPLGVKDGNYVELPAGHSYVGVLKASVLKKDPRAAILTMGQVNAAASPYPVTDAIKEGLPNIQFLNNI